MKHDIILNDTITGIKKIFVNDVGIVIFFDKPATFLIAFTDNHEIDRFGSYPKELDQKEISKFFAPIPIITNSVSIPDAESIDFGDKDFTITWSSKTPIKDFYRFEHALSESEVDKLYRLGCLNITTKTRGRSLNKINWFLNGYKVPWWAKGSLLIWWYKRLEKKLLKVEERGNE